MTIYYVDEDGIIRHTTFTENIANLEAFERELDETYEVWTYDINDLKMEDN